MKATIEHKGLRDKFYSAVGRSIVSWAEIDRALFDLCHVSLRVSKRMTAAIFYRSPNIRDHAELVDAIIRLKLEDHPLRGKLRPYWDSIIKDTRDLLEFRNQIAHNSVTQEGEPTTMRFSFGPDGTLNPYDYASDPSQRSWYELRTDDRKLLRRKPDKKGKTAERKLDRIKLRNSTLLD